MIDPDSYRAFQGICLAIDLGVLFYIAGLFLAYAMLAP